MRLMITQGRQMPARIDPEAVSCHASDFAPPVAELMVSTVSELAGSSKSCVALLAPLNTT